MKKIFVAVDFSEASRNAMDYAAALAKIFDLQVVLIHALFMPTPLGDMPGYIPVSLAEFQEEYEALLQRETEYMLQEHGIKTEGYVKMGPAAAIIKELATELSADLLLMGMKGAGKTGALFGSTAISSIRKANKPLLLIPEKAFFKPVNNICFAADFQNLPPKKQLGILEEIAAKFDGEVHILHVQNAHTKELTEISIKMGTDLSFNKIKHRFDTIEADDVEKALSDFLQKMPADLLVMVAHHHNIIERLFGTSHTKLMAYQTNLPLLVFHD